MGVLKLYTVDFAPMYAVPSGLILLAESQEQAEEMAQEKVRHTKVRSVVEVVLDKPKIIFYESGDY